jgi:ABC-2 type transport system ATP-binding protein
MSEMALTADHLIVIGRGRLIADTGVDAFVRAASGLVVHVRTPQAAELGALLPSPATVTSLGEGLLEVRGLSAAQIGELAASNRVVLHELTPQQASLEEAFMDLTQGSVEYRAGSEAPLERKDNAA